MSIEAFAVLIHEVRERLDRTPIRSGVFEAIVGEIRHAQFIAEHAENLDEVREGINRSMLELALRNVLMRSELAHAHEAAQRALRVVCSREDARRVEVPPGGRELPPIGVADLELALAHARSARRILTEDAGAHDIDVGHAMRAAAPSVVDHLTALDALLERVHAEYAA